jgi:group I intron endonuclease
MWTNNINNNKYIESSENLRARFLKYFNQNHLLKNTSMNIYKALIKHDYSKFSLTILEYCEPDKCLIREKHYWGVFNPEYNIAQDPTAPMSGRKHSDDTKTIMSEAKKINNPGRFKPGQKKTERSRKSLDFFCFNSLKKKKTQ